MLASQKCFEDQLSISMLTDKVLRVAKALLLTIVHNPLLSLAIHFPTSALAGTLGYLADSPQQNLFVPVNLQSKAQGSFAPAGFGLQPCTFAKVSFTSLFNPLLPRFSLVGVHQSIWPIWPAHPPELDFGMHLALQSA